ncbi:g5934 [Coccomyxa elongata]
MRVEAKKGSNASKVVAKANLPSKVCLVCQRPFTWRKKWEKCWDDVKYCSERCRRNRAQKAGDREATDQEDAE